MAISYNPKFQHQDWVDNVDRVQAGGSNGFNIHFHQLEDEFGHIAAIVTQVDSALAALGQAPPARVVSTTITPNLVATAVTGWAHGLGFALKPANANSAQGMMSIELPHGAVLQNLRVIGRNEGTTSGTPGTGDLRIILRRMAITADTTTSASVAQVVGVGSPFDNTVSADAQFAQVNTSQFKYFITAQLNNAGANDNVLLMAFQIAYAIQ